VDKIKSIENHRSLRSLVR